jgi:hypothetical protein
MKLSFAHACGVLAVVLSACGVAFADGPVKTEVVKTADGKMQLLRDGKPYLIKGGGGGGDKKILVESGGNSFRTWGIGADTQKELDEAQKLGLTVTLGIWLGHKEHGFDYSNAAAVKKQLDETRRSVEKFKNHPALLMWALGNEMENGGNDIPATWTAIEDLAKMVHQVDPNHPAMSVVAELGGKKVANIHQYCPDLDVVGINSYGGGPSIAERYKKDGGAKPFVITEFGPAGQWEIPKNAFGAVNELTSSAKAKSYRATYEKSVLGCPELCLGSYAFTWGFKIEATATWYGMFLPDGSKVNAVDTMQELWTGKAPEHPCPDIAKLALDGPDQVKGGDIVKAAIETSDPKGDKLKITWSLFREQGNYGVQGTGADATPSYPEAIEKNGEPAVSIQMPKSGGIYRIYCYVRNEHGGAAVGSLPVKVAGSQAPFKAPAAKLPLVLIGTGAATAYTASGWMGDHANIAMDPACTDKLREGSTACLKVEFKNAKNWAGVVWQSPASDWGDKPGGLDLTGAQKLTFWARGDKGGEKVKFGYGMVGIEKKYHDSSKAVTEVLTLTTEWKQYSIDISDNDLSCVKSGFYWTLAGQGAPLTFYLDGVKYE